MIIKVKEMRSKKETRELNAATLIYNFSFINSATGRNNK